MFGIDDAAAATLISGGATAGGSLLSSVLGNQNSQQNAQNQFFYNVALQQMQEAYNTQMSNTTYQRAVADMKSAGINPMVLGNGQSPNSAPTAGGQSVGQAETFAPDFSGLASSAQQGAKILAELKKIDQDIGESKAREKKTSRDTLGPGQAEARSSAETLATSAHGDKAWHEGKGQSMANRDYERLGKGTIGISVRGLGTVQVDASTVSRLGVDGVKKLLSPGEHGSPQSPSVPHSAHDLKTESDHLDPKARLKKRLIEEWSK